MSNMEFDVNLMSIRPLDDTVDNDTAMDNGQDDEDASEQDDLPSERDRPNIRMPSNLDEDAQDPLRNEDAAQEGESDIEFFHEAETESDSDDNQSTQDAQRSVQTGATAGSDTGNLIFFFFYFLKSDNYLSLPFMFVLFVRAKGQALVSTKFKKHKRSPLVG